MNCAGVTSNNIRTQERNVMRSLRQCSSIQRNIKGAGEHCETVSGHSYPLLPVAVLQVVGGAVVPVEPDADEHGRQKTVFSHDDKVGEEAAESLDHTWRQSSVSRHCSRFV